MDQPRTQGFFKGKIPGYDVELRIYDLTTNKKSLSSPKKKQLQKSLSNAPRYF